MRKYCGVSRYLRIVERRNLSESFSPSSYTKIVWTLNMAQVRAIKETLRDLSSLVASSRKLESGIAIEIFKIDNSMRLAWGISVCQS